MSEQQHDHAHHLKPISHPLTKRVFSRAHTSLYCPQGNTCQALALSPGTPDKKPALLARGLLVGLVAVFDGGHDLHHLKVGNMDQR